MGDKKKGNKKATGKPNGNAKRLVLRQGNRAYNQQLKVRTKGKRFSRGLPGSPQGKHVKGEGCNCGGCSTGTNKKAA